MKTISDFLDKKEKLLSFILPALNPWQLGIGWHGVKGKGINSTCWTKENATYYLKGSKEEYLIINYKVTKKQLIVKPLKFKIFFNGKKIGEEEHTQPGWQLKSYKVKPREVNEVRITSNIFIPHLLNGDSDHRELGLNINYSALVNKEHSLVKEAKKRQEITEINKALKKRIIKNTSLEEKDFKINLIELTYKNILEKYKDDII